MDSPSGNATPSSGPRGGGRNAGMDNRRGMQGMQQHMDGGNMGMDRRMNGYNEKFDNSGKNDFQFNPEAMNFIPSGPQGGSQKGGSQKGGHQGGQQGGHLVGPQGGHQGGHPGGHQVGHQGDVERMGISIAMSPGGSLSGKMNFDGQQEQFGPGGQGMHHMQGRGQQGMGGGQRGADLTPMQGMGPGMGGGGMQGQGGMQGPGMGGG